MCCTTKGWKQVDWVYPKANMDQALWAGPSSLGGGGNKFWKNQTKAQIFIDIIALFYLDIEPSP
jgi:hypothetical protein